MTIGRGAIGRRPRSAAICTARGPGAGGARRALRVAAVPAGSQPAGGPRPPRPGGSCSSIGEPRLTPAIVAVDTAIRSTHGVAVAGPRDLLHRVPGPQPVRGHRAPARAARAAPPEVRDPPPRPDRGGRQPRAPDRPPQPGGPLLGRPRRVRRPWTRRPPPTSAWTPMSPVRGSTMGWAETLELARRLQPEIRRAVVVDGVSPADRVWMAAGPHAARGVGRADRGRLSHRPEPRRHPHGGAAPARSRRSSWSACSCATRRGGTSLRPRPSRGSRPPPACPCTASPRPDRDRSRRRVRSSSFEAHGQVAAELALRVLAGERPAPTDMGTSVPMFDARQIARWGLDARRLPAGQRRAVPGAVAVGRAPVVHPRRPRRRCSLQGGLIGGLLVPAGPAPPGPAEPRRALAVRDTPLRPRGPVRGGAPPDRGERTSRRGLAADRWRASASTGPPSGRSDGARRGPARAAWTRDGVPARPAVIREVEAPWIAAPAPPGSRVHLARPAICRMRRSSTARRSGTRHRVDRRGPARRGRRRSSGCRRSAPPTRGALVRPAEGAAPAPGRGLRQRPGATARRRRGAGERRRRSAIWPAG